MKILTITGNHPRHLHYVWSIHKKHKLAGMVIENRGKLIPDRPPHLGLRDRANFDLHFENRRKKEHQYFGYYDGVDWFPGCPRMLVHPRDHAGLYEHDINSPAVCKFVKRIAPDIVLIFGTKMIRDPLYSLIKDKAVNLHLGLSPRYRGAATLFWPFYFLEPNWAGCTFHYIVNEPDAGNIIHQCRPQLERGDTIHDVACKAVIEATESMTALLEKPFISWVAHRQKNTGKCFLRNDFQPAHLRMIYDAFCDDIVDQYLDGNLTEREPWMFQGNFT